MSVILVVDDVPALRDQYAYDLRRLGGHEVLAASGGAEALRILEEEAVDCVVLDLEMPGVDGFEVLTTLAARGSTVPVLVYTGTGNFERCARAIRLGALAFIDKADPIERVAREVENAVERGRLVRQVAALSRPAEGDSPLVGESAAARALREAVARLAPIPSPVLVLGESGSGKELVARELHARSGRRGAFLAVNCAALPDNLVESELFGHERGAFTGADRVRRGAFETASGGTLLLDEVGELAGSAQAKLLRVLEDGNVTRLGGGRAFSVDTRVVGATHRDLDADTESGRFRRDLLYRLNAHVIRVPALRERLEDLPLLLRAMLPPLYARLRVRPRGIAPEAAALLAGYGWERNNVRELRNVLERMILAAGDAEIGPEHVPGEIGGGAAARKAAGRTPPSSPLPGRAAARVEEPAAGTELSPRGREATSAPAEIEAKPVTLREGKLAAERALLLAALARNRWHVSKAAEELGLSDHASLLKILRRHGISRPD